MNTNESIEPRFKIAGRSPDDSLACFTKVEKQIIDFATQQRKEIENLCAQEDFPEKLNDLAEAVKQRSDEKIHKIESEVVFFRKNIVPISIAVTWAEFLRWKDLVQSFADKIRDDRDLLMREFLNGGGAEAQLKKLKEIWTTNADEIQKTTTSQPPAQSVQLDD